MNRVSIVISLFLLCPIISLAQQVFDFGDNIDKFSLITSRSEVRYSREIPNEIPTTESGKLLLAKDIVLTKDTIPTEKFKYPYYSHFAADSLRSMSIGDWETMLKNKTLIVEKDSSTVMALNTHNASLMFYTEYVRNKSRSKIMGTLPNGFEYDYAYFIPCAYAYMKIAENKYIILLRNHQIGKNSFDGYVIPFNNKVEVKIRHTGMNLDYNTIQYPLYDNDSLYYRELRSSGFYTTTPTDDGRQQLCDYFGFRHPIVADTIQLTGEYVIANNLKKQQCIVYDKVLKKLPIKKVRSVTSNLQMLVGKKMKWFENGILLDEPAHRMIGYPDLPSRFRFKMEKIDDNFIFHQSGTTQYGENREEQLFTLTNAENIDSIFFENRQITLSTSHFPHARSPRNIDILYTKTKEGKYNICTYTTDHNAKEITLIPMLTTDVECVEMKHPHYFYDKGKVGYYPEMKTADYKKLNNYGLKIHRLLYDYKSCECRL